MWWALQRRGARCYVVLWEGPWGVMFGCLNRELRVAQELIRQMGGKSSPGRREPPVLGRAVERGSLVRKAGGWHSSCRAQWWLWSRWTKEGQRDRWGLEDLVKNFHLWTWNLGVIYHCLHLEKSASSAVWRMWDCNEARVDTQTR